MAAGSRAKGFPWYPLCAGTPGLEGGINTCEEGTGGGGDVKSRASRDVTVPSPP